MRALVSGGSGFIGSNLVDALVARGDRVLVVDDLSTGREENLTSALEAGAELTVTSVTNASSIEGLVGEFSPDAVFHLAAQVDVRRAVREPAHDATVNVVGTEALLEATRRAGGARFVFASTGGAVYGEGDGRELPLPRVRRAAPIPPTARASSPQRATWSTTDERTGCRPRRCGSGTCTAPGRTRSARRG